MRVLALDTTTRAGSVAVVEDDRIVLQRGGDPARTHVERLPAEILSLLQDAGLALPAVDVFAVAAGPGSFTGLRVGIATIQGLAFVQHRKVVALSALAALAQAGSAELRQALTWAPGWMRTVGKCSRPCIGSQMLRWVRWLASSKSIQRRSAPASTVERWSAGPPSTCSSVMGPSSTRRSSRAGLSRPRCWRARWELMAVDRARPEKPWILLACTLSVRRPDVEIERERKSVLDR